MQFTNCTTREPLFHDLYGSYKSYESCQAIHGSYLFDSIGQGCLQSVVKIFDDAVVLLQVNVYDADKNCNKTCVSLFKQIISKCPLFQKKNLIISRKCMVAPYFHFTFQ